jgi:hypothetical protein
LGGKEGYLIAAENLTDQRDVLVIESFKGRRRDEYSRVNHFYSRSNAKSIIGLWKKDYGATRPLYSWVFGLSGLH